jgi:hypothetical protein
LCGVRYRRDKQTFEDIAQATERALNRERASSNTAPYVVVFGIAVTAAIEWKRQQPYCIDNIAFAAIVSPTRTVSSECSGMVVSAHDRKRCNLKRSKYIPLPFNRPLNVLCKRHSLHVFCGIRERI